jgi:hypothetical protein
MVSKLECDKAEVVRSRRGSCRPPKMRSLRDRAARLRPVSSEDHRALSGCEPEWYHGTMNKIDQ